MAGAGARCKCTDRAIRGRAFSRLDHCLQTGHCRNLALLPGELRPPESASSLEYVVNGLLCTVSGRCPRRGAVRRADRSTSSASVWRPCTPASGGSGPTRSKGSYRPQPCQAYADVLMCDTLRDAIGVNDGFAPRGVEIHMAAETTGSSIDCATMARRPVRLHVRARRRQANLPHLISPMKRAAGVRAGL
jgi:hypothetical protein